MILINTMNGGGAEKVCLTLCNYFAEKGLDVSLILIRHQGVFLNSLHPNVKVSSLHPRLVRANIVGRLIAFWWLLVKLRPVAVLAVGEWPNVIAPLSNILYANKARVVISEHNALTFINAPEKYGRSKLLSLIAKFAYTKTNQIVYVSEEVKKSVLRTLPRIEAKGITINNPIDSKLIQELSSQPFEHHWINDHSLKVIVSVGRFYEQKDYPTLIAAFADAYSKNRSLRLVILGVGPLQNEIEARVSDLGIAQAVDFMGFQDNPYRIMSRAVCLLHSAKYEGFPMVFVEAMACGLPIVTTNCNIPLEIFDGQDLQYVVPVSDSAALAQALLSRIELPVDKKTIMAKVSKYDVVNIAELYMDSLGLSA